MSGVRTQVGCTTLWWGQYSMRWKGDGENSRCADFFRLVPRPELN